MTVCQIKRNNAEERIRAILEAKTPPMMPTPASEENDTGVSDEVALPNLEEYARDQIRTYIGQKFRSHDLSSLVGALLQADGYTTELSPPGPDGGVDIIAGRGAMGFDPPRLYVQVKSSKDPVDVKVLRELQGVMRNFGAEQGLLVSWGGFKQSVHNEARRLFFEMRLWDAGDVVEMLLKHYDRLPDDLRTELPLKRTWTPVLED